MLRSLSASILLSIVFASAALAGAEQARDPLVIGDTFTIGSKALGETRRINVYVPAVSGAPKDLRLPVLYMPDGGMGEDFLHIAGLVQISVANGTMRPFILVGIENTQRRRDMTGPTSSEDDRKIAPVVGGSAAFRDFLRKELIPAIAARYRVTDESAIVGESLAGLFVVETFFLEPSLFDTYIAIDPSLWWNNQELANNAEKRLTTSKRPGVSLFIASSGDGINEPIEKLVEVLRGHAAPSVRWHYEPMPNEKHSTIYHPAALLAFRTFLAPSK